MCFFIYAPATSLNIEYANEIITLLPDGSSEIQIEFLLENLSTSPVERFFLIYPNIFLKAESNEMKRFTPVGSFKNTTGTLLSRDLPENSHYTSENILEKNFSVDGDVATVVESSIYGYESEYSGKVKDVDEDLLEINFYENPTGQFTQLNYKETALLLQNKITHFVFNLQESLESSSKRWFRFYFRPKYTTARKLKWYEKLIKPYFYPYQIKGP